MIRRVMGSLRRAATRASVPGVLAGAAALATSLALAAPALAECPNETLRSESNVNSATGKPYSEGLPNCRAYEMVSPLYKQAQNAQVLPIGGSIALAPGGETAAWSSLGDFSNPENFPRVDGNIFLSQRGASGWTTSSAYAPRSLVDLPYLSGLGGDSAPDLRSVRASCGPNPPSKGERSGESYTLVCARREGEAAWTSTPGYDTVTHKSLGQTSGYLGASSDMSRVFLEPLAPLLPEDAELAIGFSGIYELAGCCTAASTLRLVNVDNKGKELLLRDEKNPTATLAGPLIGDTRPAPAVLGSSYHAISTSGGTVFFTATPNEPEAEKEVQTVYARVRHGESFETVAVSKPSEKECSQCNQTAPPQNATFQGASADGSKVFFTTKQQLLSKETEGAEGVTPNLYEYDFNGAAGQKLVLLSADEAGANVTGVARSSSDGSHVYFVATGALKVEKNANGEEANGNGEQPKAGMSNLYGYDTATGEIKFVAGGQSAGEVVGGVSATGSTVSLDSAREAQTTPDGRYLVFSSPLKVSGDTNGGPLAKAVYRYDFQTDALEWVSHGAPGFNAKNEGKPALVAAIPVTTSGPVPLGAEANIDELARAISENGESIIFTTGEKLQAGDVNKAPDVYEWHSGTVAIISDGHDEAGVGANETAMSASGSDIFFLTRMQLVGQDTDVLRDLYDARVGGGFPRPNEASCAGEACQGPLSPPPGSPSAASSVFSGGQNLAPPLISVATPTNTKPKPKPLTRAQLLAKALKACKGKAKRKRVVCESQARKKYGVKVKSKKSRRRGR